MSNVQNLKIVEFASVLAGPAVGMFFAELGAEVWKIENPTTGGDMTRHWRLPEESPDAPQSAYFSSVNFRKKHLFLDLAQPSDLAKAKDLVRDADVVISNFKPSSARKMGVDADSLRQLNPRLIYAQLDAFADPEDIAPAFDVVLQAEAGFLFMTGEPGRAPVKMPVALIDLLAAHQLKEGILLALWQREQSGEGCTVRTSLFESAVASLANQATNFLMAGKIPQKMGTAHPNIAPYGDVFAAADGREIVLAVGTERQFEKLCQVLGLKNLLQKIDFQTNTTRVANRQRLNGILAKAIEQHDSDFLLKKFRTSGVPAGRIRNMAEVFDLPEAQAMILEEKIGAVFLSRRVRTVAFQLFHSK